MMNLKKKMMLGVGGMLLAGTMAAGAQVIVRIGPPPVRQEVIPAMPHRGLVWQAGYNRWDGHAYVWVPGRYAQPPYAHARWVAGHWAHRGGGYVFVEGHWRR